MTEETDLQSIDLNRAVTLTDDLVRQHTGQHLNAVQVLIFKEAWQGSRKTYKQLAEENQYSAGYLQQGVGPKLWRLLSGITGEKVSKGTVKMTLSRYFAKTGQLLDDATSTHEAVSTVPTIDRPVSGEPQWIDAALLEPLDDSQQPLITYPEGSVPLGSPLYIQRGQDDDRCKQEVILPGALIRIRGPRQMGKTSLLNRILAHAQTSNYKTVLLNFQQAEVAVLSDMTRLLRWICANLAVQLGLPPQLEQYWDEDLGSKMSCNFFLQSYILRQCQTPLVIAFDEVNELLEYPQVAQEFLTLLRFWHERSKLDGQWRTLRLIMVHSTEIYVSLDVNQSPLNVGLSIHLHPFDAQQMAQLAERHELTLSKDDIDVIEHWVGGHPHLVRLTLYHLSQGLTLNEVLSTAATDTSIYRQHLHRHLGYLNQYPEIRATFEQILAAAEPISVDQVHGFKLQSLGLVRLDRNKATVTCGLYQQYFDGRA